MSDSQSADTKLHSPISLSPENLDTLVKDAIDRERRGGVSFQTLNWIDNEEEFKQLLDIIGTIVQAPVPEILPSMISDAILAYKDGTFENFAEKYFSRSTGSAEREDRSDPFRDDALRNGFIAEYRGNCPQVFVERLKQYGCEYCTGPLSHHPYSWSIPIVQSSGMGKSRLMREVSRLVFVIPMNVRKALPSTISVYPPTDHNVREYFLDLASKTDIEVQAGCAIFLAQLFKRVRELVSQWEPLPVSALVKKWADYLEDGESTNGVGPNRLRLYEKVVSQSRERWQGPPRSLRRIANELLAESLKLKDFIRQSPSDFFCVSFDEAHALTTPRADLAPDAGKKHSVYLNLQTVLSWVYSDSPFFIFLSRSSNILRLTPSIGPHPSSGQVLTGGLVLLPPWTEFPLNVFAQETMQAHNPLNLDVVSTVEFMTGMGRPLWHAHYTQEVALGQDIWFRHVFSTAQGNLASSLEDSENYLAAIGVRIGFTFEAMSTRARALEERMVEQHMRVAAVVPFEREYMRTTAPPEPILAEAAGRVCNLSKHGTTTLKQYFGQGVLTCGERGEVLGRLLLTLAHDEALQRAEFRRIYGEPMLHRPITLLDLLKALFHEDYHETVLDARPTGDPRGVPLRDAFKDAYIHFSHFGIAASNDTFNVQNMFKCLATGTALRGSMERQNIDAVIPVHLGSTSSPISEATTSSINLQFNYRDKAKVCHVDRTIVIPNEEVPTISLIMELGTNPEETGVVAAGVGRTNSKPPPGSFWDGKHYELVVYGHHAKTYSVVSEEMEPTFAHILAATRLKVEYPHSGNERMVGLQRNTQLELTPEVLVWPRNHHPGSFE